MKSLAIFLRAVGLFWVSGLAGLVLLLATLLLAAGVVRAVEWPWFHDLLFRP